MRAAMRFMRHIGQRIVRRDFREAAAESLHHPVATSILDNLHAPGPHDAEQEHAYAEHVLRTQMEEWSHEGKQQHEGFDYGSAAGFDLHL